VDAEYLKADTHKDLAVIRAKMGTAKLDFARVGDLQHLKQGSPLYAIGQPTGKAWGVTYAPGFLSNVFAWRLQLQSAHIQPGHSGAALVDQQGRIVGIVNDTDGTTATAFRIDRALDLLKLDLEMPVDLGVTGQADNNSVPIPGEKKLNARDGQEYVWIPAGQFMMGCSVGDHDCLGDEELHSVTISKGFWMGQTAVTSGSWKRYRAAAGTKALPTSDKYGRKNWNEAGDDNMPAVMLTWDEARSYCEWAGMRLPTEAEWEYAARAGTSTARYGELHSIAWSGENSGNQVINTIAVENGVNLDPILYQQKLFENGNFVHAVGQRTPNPWRLFDILGNVYTWTADWYDASYYARSELKDPTGPPSGKTRVARGGSWLSDPNFVRVSYRNAIDPTERNFGVGCRCVGELP
jgi:formylglycine-generating enzyme required for sulfatase activity